MVTALITGITGQDGSYLAEFLLKKGYGVYGLYRRSSTESFQRLQKIKSKINLICGDLTDQSSINEAIKRINPDEVYNLAAQSFVPESWTQPMLTTDVTAVGALRILEAIRSINPKIKFYQASSSEMFGKVQEVPQTEKTPFYPRSPYGVSKVYAFWMAKNYRESYNLFCANGILFNHESPRRGKQFVTRKVTDSVAKIKLGLQNELFLGNLESKRDWGYAGDYCIDLDTCILTKEGFKYYDEIKTGTIVLNYNTKTDRLEQDKVIKKILLENRGKMYVFSGRGFYLRCSANHRIYYQKKSKVSKGGWSDWKVCEAATFYNMSKDLKLRTKYDFRLPHTQGYKNKDLKVKDEWFKLIGYLLSEGSLYDGNRHLRISLSQSKIVNKKVYRDIKRVLKNLKLTYRARERSDGVVEFIFSSDSSREIISYFDNFNIHKMPSWVYAAGDGQLRLLFKAMMDGDGSWGVMTYVSKRKDLIFSFQTLATILGYRTIINRRKSGILECVSIALRKKYAYVTGCREEKSNEKIWCVTTKNGTIVTYKNEGISVSGNCEAMWLMLQHDKPDDFVIATGETHSIRQLCEVAFSHVGLNYKDYVKTDPKFLRPAEVDMLVGDYSKAKKELGWEPKVRFKELIEMMVDSDLEKNKKEVE